MNWQQREPAPPRSDELFATIHQQTKHVLGEADGFYVVTSDDHDDVVHVVYHVDNARAGVAGAVYDAGLCDVVAQKKSLINDNFARLLCNDVANSIAVPLIRNGVIYGCFGAYTREPRVYDARDARALVAIAEIGALAIENTRMLADIQQARREAERLEEIGRAISSSLDLADVLRTVVDAATEMLGADSATVWLLRGDDEVEVAMTAGDIAPPMGLIIPVPEELRHRMVDLGKPYFVYDDLKTGGHELRLGMRNLTTASSTMAVALHAEREMLGALSVGNREPVRYRSSQIQLLERLSLVAAIAVANARLHEQIRALSLTDPLTAMPNRRHLDIFLEKEFAAARRGRKLSVLLFDLDHFKAYNDRMGHQAGDAVLQAFGHLLVAQTRAMNLAARLGGDEFITILADTDLGGAQAHADRILRAMRQDPLLGNSGVIASVGIAAYQPEMETFDDLIRAADRDLYVRKNSRRGIA